MSTILLSVYFGLLVLSTVYQVYSLFATQGNAVRRPVEPGVALTAVLLGVAGMLGWSIFPSVITPVTILAVIFYGIGVVRNLIVGVRQETYQDFWTLAYGIAVGIFLLFATGSYLFF